MGIVLYVYINSRITQWIPLQKAIEFILFENQNDFTMCFSRCNANCIRYMQIDLREKITCHQRNKMNLFMEYPKCVAHAWWRPSWARHPFILWFLWTQFFFLSWHYKETVEFKNQSYNFFKCHFPITMYSLRHKNKSL